MSSQLLFCLFWFCFPSKSCIVFFYVYVYLVYECVSRMAIFYFFSIFYSNRTNIIAIQTKQIQRFLINFHQFFFLVFFFFVLEKLDGTTLNVTHVHEKRKKNIANNKMSTTKHNNYLNICICDIRILYVDWIELVMCRQG